MDALVEDGFVVLGGPVGDVDSGRALLVVRAEARTRSVSGWRATPGPRSF